MSRTNYKKLLSEQQEMTAQLTGRIDTLVAQQQAAADELLAQLNKTISIKGELILAQQQVSRLTKRIAELEQEG